MTPRATIIGILALAFSAWLFYHFFRPVEAHGPIVILGHGGLGVRSTYPLNSLESIQSVLSYPIDGTELDIQMTADSVLVAFHDGDLEKSTDCTGKLQEKSLYELRNCQNSTWLRSRPIATLSSVLKNNKVKDKTFSLDIKIDTKSDPLYTETVVNRILAVAENHPETFFFIESDNLETLTLINKKNSSFSTYYYSTDINSDMKKVLNEGITGISIDLKHATAQNIATAKKKGISIMLWGAGSVSSNRKAIEMNPDIIQTDDVESMVRLLNLGN